MSDIERDYSLSVVIPNYNKEKTIKRCIDSILSQTFVPSEIIVVDDCSTDGSRDIILNLKSINPIIKPVFLEKNGGVSNARNIGLMNVSSEYVTYIDSDDYYYADYKLMREMKLIRKYAEKGEDVLAYSATVNVSEDGVPLYIPVLKPRWFLNGSVFVKLVSRIKTETIPRDYIVKKCVIEKAGAYSYPKNLYEDLDLLIRISKLVRFFCTYGYGTGYVQTVGGLSDVDKKKDKVAVEELIRIYDNQLSNIDKMVSCIYKCLWYIERKILRIIRRILTGI